MKENRQKFQTKIDTTDLQLRIEQDRGSFLIHAYVYIDADRQF